MESRHLKYFIAVAEELSFTRAALRLHIAQPPLSQQIKALESELGAMLFDRSERQISLTQEGQEFYREAKKIIDGMEGLKHKIARVAKGEEAEIVVGMISSMASPAFAGLLRKFKQQNPGIRIVLMDSSSSWQLEALQSGTIDVAFLNIQTLKIGPLQAFPIRSDKLKLALPTNHRLAKKAKVKWGELRDEDFILVGQDIAFAGYYSEFFELCREEGFTPRISQYTKNIVSQLWMVSASLGLAPIPMGPDLQNHHRGIKLVGLPRTQVLNEMSLVWRKKETSAAIVKFIDFFKTNHPQLG